MDIGRTEGVHGPGRVEGPKKIQKAQPPQLGGTPPPSDKVEISDGARLISEVTSLPPSRQEKIDEIRRLIESGQFDTETRLEGAIERLLRDHPELLG